MLQEKHITLEKHFEELYIYGIAYQVWHTKYTVVATCYNPLLLESLLTKSVIHKL